MSRTTENELRYNSKLASQPARPYQKEAIRRAIRGLDADQPILVHVPTGGGKTRIGNDLLVEVLSERGGWVLWIAPRWDLLQQAAVDLVQRHKGYLAKIVRLGGKEDNMPGVSDDVQGAEVAFTTIQTYLSWAKDGQFQGCAHPTLIIWDECHKGECAKTGRTLFDRRRWRHTPVLGLTATPRRPEVSRYEVIYSKTFYELLQEGYLAQPIPVTHGTGTSWSPVFNRSTGDVTEPSLRELGSKKERNQVIVQHYVKHQKKYGKTLIFCCDIKHSNALATRLASQSGVPARAVNCKNGEQFNRECIKAFRQGNVQVVTNVAMMTHGFDIPDIQTIFLCRPTGSDILFSQMVGRGARKDEKTGKNSFYLVEFTDNIEKHGDKLTSTQTFFAGTGLQIPRSEPVHPTRQYRPVEKIERQQFDPYGLPTWITDRPDVPEPIRNLWFRRDQTFGIEFEMTMDDFDGENPGKKWIEVAEELRQALVDRLGDRVANRCSRNPRAAQDHGLWNIVYDRTCGWEVTSRILKNQEGYAEVVEACEAITEAMERTGLKVTHNTGTHVHLGWRAKNRTELLRAVQLVRVFEPALATLVAPSRVVSFDGVEYDTDEPNFYCRPVSHVLNKEGLGGVKKAEDLFRLLSESEEARYLTFNIVPLQDIQTVEVRFHSGTTDAGKILLWLSLWQQILWAAANKLQIEEVPDCPVIVPNRDVLVLARKYLPAVQQPEFLDRLKARRDHVVGLWRNHDELLRWAKNAQRW